jgi:TM2 domain-containing membrane protein YozV
MSFFLLGLGQLVKGHVGKAFLMWGATIALLVGSPTWVVPFVGLPVIWIWNIYDAYNSNTKKPFG